CAGCGKSDDSKITVYRIPKENQPNAIAQQSTMGNAVPAEVHWTAPAGWIEQAASGFRKGSFLVRDTDGKTADVSVISFPEAAGVQAMAGKRAPGGRRSGVSTSAN